MPTELSTIVTNMLSVFEAGKEGGLLIVGGAIALGVIFVVARWLWARLRQWFAKAG